MRLKTVTTKRVAKVKRKGLIKASVAYDTVCDYIESQALNPSGEFVNPEDALETILCILGYAK